jgi:lactoylglutathione lyase
MSITSRFAFTKIFVDDLDAESAFYQSTFGLSEKTRYASGEGAEAVEQILLTSAHSDDSDFILWRYFDRPTPAPGESTAGFAVADLDDTVRRVTSNGGSVTEPPKVVVEAGVKVAMFADPEGHIIEVIQYL